MPIIEVTRRSLAEIEAEAEGGAEGEESNKSTQSQPISVFGVSKPVSEQSVEELMATLDQLRDERRVRTQEKSTKTRKAKKKKEVLGDENVGKVVASLSPAEKLKFLEALKVMKAMQDGKGG